MIYYFSGTGNSYRVAEALAQRTNDSLKPMTGPAAPSDELPQSGPVGLVFPVYAWGMPLVVERFVRSFPWSSCKGYVYAVLTCGDDVGRTDTLLRKAVGRAGGKVQAVFSVRMRNTYVCLPGFDTDSEATVSDKEEKARGHIAHIADIVNQRLSVSGHAEVRPGAMPWTKTYVLRPLFNKFLVSPRHFHTAPGDLCKGCGKCARRCPLGCIKSAEGGRPVWTEHCTHCLRCYHACPVRAIRYGRFTGHKGQVSVPNQPF